MSENLPDVEVADPSAELETDDLQDVTGGIRQMGKFPASGVLPGQGGSATWD